jgi:ABC-type branched-subunit amino acid transport system ATPase component/ABC-type branched-subunit amino acid transport system permease subunit
VDPLRFALLGLGAGAAYGLVGQGLVLIYRGAGIVNFAQGAMGMCGAYLFFLLRDGHGVPLAVALTLSLVASCAGGALVHLLIMRPLRNATPLVRLISTLALMLTLLTAVEHSQNGGDRAVSPVLPTTVIRPLSNTPIGADRLILFGIALAATILLTVSYRRTWFGLATSAVAENARAAGTAGISPDVVASINWALASILSASATIFIASLGGEFNPQTLTLLVIPGLAAALVGGFSSFSLAFGGAVAIGIAQSEIGRYVKSGGWAVSGPFIVIVVMLALRGRALPARGETSKRGSALGTGASPMIWSVAAFVAVVVAVWVTSTSWVSAITATALSAIILLSLVVVVGYAGQLSLAQYTLAGMGAWVSTRLVASDGFPFLIAALVGVLAAVLIGVVVGLASLRARGVNLAVATLGAGEVLEQVVLLNPARTGGIAGTQVGNLRVFGVHLDAVDHPQRYATLVVGALAVLMLMVANLRRSTSGRRLLAIRGNERAAASLGVNVFGAKLYAFGLSAGIAAIGGVLAAFEYPDVVFTQYTVLNSVTAVMQAVVGGIGYIVGSLIGGTLTAGSVTGLLLQKVISSSSSAFVLALVGAAGALAILVFRPEGVASKIWWPSVLSRRLTRSLPSPKLLAAGAELTLEPIPPSRLDLEDLGVQYGGVQALGQVSLTISSGEILGLIGPNGSGKTTLIDAVTGYAPTSSGTIKLNGLDVGGETPATRARLGIGRTFQNLELFPGMTVADNLRVASDTHALVAYARDLVRPGNPALSEMATLIARALELEEVLEHRTETLPFGQQRLVAIARALVARPSVVLLDEPAAGLGSEDTEELGRLLRRLADQMNLAILVIEHDINLVTSICDRVVVLDRGLVIATGPPEEALADAAVAVAFLGASSHKAEGASTNGGVKMASAAVRSALPAQTPSRLLQGVGVTSGYGSLAAVRDVDIEVGTGEIVALLGPNGAGKTTTLLTLAGAIDVMEGTVLWKGEGFKGKLHHRVRQGLAIVTEERSTFAQLTTEANLRLARGDMSKAFDLFPELKNLVNRRAGLLSGGEQQMLSLARALSMEPEVLLVDELSLGLAPIVVDRLYAALHAAAGRGLGVIVVEQYTQRALDIADRVYVLSNGKVTAHGEAEEFRRDPERLRRSYLALSTSAS